MWPVNIIVCVDNRSGFAKDGEIPWNFKKDWARFKEITKGHYCIMGRRTYEDIAARKLKRKKAVVLPFDEPILSGRESIVLSRDPDHFAAQGATVRPEIQQALDLDCTDKKKEVFILGGDKLFTEVLPFVKMVYLTTIEHDYECDRFFGMRYVDEHFKIIKGEETEEKGKTIYFTDWKRIKE